MYECFTNRARQVFVLANQEAHRLRQEYIGTDLLLLGIIKEGGGVAMRVLKHLNVNLEELVLSIEELISHRSQMVEGESLPKTPRTKNVITLAMEEARHMAHTYIGTEHILIGLRREEEGVAAQLLTNQGIEVNRLRQEVLNVLHSGRIIGIHDGTRRLLEEDEAALGKEAVQRIDTESVIAVDIGNSRIKIGRFEPRAVMKSGLPEPSNTFDLPITHDGGEFDAAQFHSWCDKNIAGAVRWLVGSVHRGAAAHLIKAVADWSVQSGRSTSMALLTYRDVPLEVHVDQPEQVGIDRLLSSFAASCLCHQNMPAIIVSLGTAITVDLLKPDGVFAGGAILPGISMSARALADDTDALPHVNAERLEKPRALGKSTTAAIESGLYWGAIGAIRELVLQLSATLTVPPELFLTGGASWQIVDELADAVDVPVRHVPHLVLAGIALVDAEAAGNAGG